MPAKVHYADGLPGAMLPLCWRPPMAVPVMTRNTRKVTCKLCLRLLGAK